MSPERVERVYEGNRIPRGFGFHHEFVSSGVAKHLVDRIWEPRGPVCGTKLTEMEALLVAIREVLTERMLAQALQRQAADPATERPPNVSGVAVGGTQGRAGTSRQQCFLGNVGERKMDNVVARSVLV